MAFIPKRVFFEREALEYPLGKKLYNHFLNKKDIDLFFLKSHNRVTGIPGKTIQEAYREGKKTLVVGVRKTMQFQTCKPSAHYQLPLVTGCMGACEYCYLNTQFGRKPYVRVYVNIEEILARAESYIKRRKPDITVFEGAATSDPVPVEPYTGALSDTIEFFASQESGRFRFVTKYTDLEGIFDLKHNNRTTVRFSINADQIINQYEHFTPSLKRRIETAKKVASSGYPLGFIIGPVILFNGWQDSYKSMLDTLKEQLRGYPNSRVNFEIISHRFTPRAKKTILEVFPQSSLPMDETKRKFKYGQFGYGKYVYTPEDMKKINLFFKREIAAHFPGSTIDYII